MDYGGVFVGLFVPVEEILSKKDRRFAGKTLSAKGLFFLGPKYDLKFNIASPTQHLMDRFKR